MSRTQSRGSCTFCGREFAKGGLSRHLPTCAKRLEAQTEADRGKRHRQTLYHLQVQDAWGASYFLHLEIRGNATLKDLDEYLRAIWLECCGHLSAFEIAGVSYDNAPDPWGESEGPLMGAVKVSSVFRPGLEIAYEYDFGTTSELTIKVMAQREGKPLTEHPIFLMARNGFEPPPCMICGEPATWLCSECIYDREDDRGELCDEHADGHEHEDMMLALVNSPRTGMCGYSGPAEPPY
jgi:hypothetical protein